MARDSKVGDVAFIDGGDIYLRELRESDLEGRWYLWLNDPEVTKYQNKGIRPNTLSAQRAYYETVCSSDSDVVLAIIHGESEAHIGNVGLHKIDWVHRSAELGIVIGEPVFWGRSYGKIAWNLIAGYGFRRLNLHRLYAWIVADNVASLKAALASGFRKEGKARHYLFKNGRYLDAVFVNALDSDFIDLGSDG